MNMDRIKDGEVLARTVEKFVNGARQDGFEAFAEYMVHKFHRTLQQTFMRMIVVFIQKVRADASFDGRNESTYNLCCDIAKVLDEGNHFLPYI